MPSGLVEFPAIARLYSDPRITREDDGLLHYDGLYPSLSELLDVIVHKYPRRVAVKDGMRSTTYAQLWANAAHIAGGLKTQGAAIGDRIVIGGAHSVRWVEAFVGAILAGGVPVPMPVGAPTTDAKILDSGASFVLDGALPEGTSFIDDGASPDELALLCYNGSGFGVELSNENVLSAVESIVHARGFDDGGLCNLMVTTAVTPITMVVELLSTLVVGGTAVITERVDPVYWRSTGADVLTASPTVLADVTTRHPVTDFGRRAVRWIDYSAASAQEEEALRSAFPNARHFSGWGRTETCGSGFVLPDGYESTHADSIGVPFGGMEIALFGPGAEQGRGELLCRGPAVTRGYWLQPQETERRFRGGWFHTGNTVTIDSEGFVRIVDSEHAA
ncbi:MAG: long-chain fatty acid--CoA ligase [Rhodococcus sp.]|nr:long-chain fatty acid--CoA ligase [Rhodococcus sp. (in: high G+C Gram-positive bacteria)]